MELLVFEVYFERNAVVQQDAELQLKFQSKVQIFGGFVKDMNTLLLW